MINMKDTKIVRLAKGYTTVRKTKNPNAVCMKCHKKIFSWSASCGFEGVICKSCNGKDEW